jgi:hypothetical protein
MTKKWKIFGYKTDIEWYDIKTKFKQLLRKLTYSWLVQELICLVVLSYMRFVFHSSKKIFINREVAHDAVQNRTPLIISFWHNRLMMVCFAVQEPKKFYDDYKMMTLASKHGDGKFVGKVMEKMGLVSILGSSKDGRKASRGIDVGTFKKILSGLKQGNSLGITPDGPRGPNQKVNGEIVGIARVSQSKILPMSYSASRFKRLRTWDKFYLPLPFSTLCFYFDDKLITVAKDASAEEMKEIEKLVEERMNFVQEQSQKFAAVV